MLSIKGIANSEYYENLAAEDYYEKGKEPAGQYQGTGAHNLGMKGQVQTGELEMLLKGFNSKTGEAVASNAGDKHRKGHDLCFSAPKSVSVMWANASPEMREQIEQAQAKAVAKAVDYTEKNVAHTRQGKGGVEREKANIIAAAYEHGTSRSQDPQVHTHLTVASHGIGQESGKANSLNSLDFYQHKKAIGAIYRAELANELQQTTGCKIERDGESFAIAGSNKEIEKHYSKRSEEIKKQMNERGTSGSKAAEAAALTGRPVKENISRKELFETWENEGKEFGFNMDDMLNNDNLEFDEPEFDGDKVLKEATENQAVFTKANLHMAVAQELQGVGGADKLEGKINELQESGELIQLGKKNGMEQYTTKEILQLEQDIVDFAKNGQNKDDWKLSEESINEAIEAKEGISKEQQNALRHITGSGQVSCVTGAAGTGKSFMLEAAKDAFESEGYKVTGCSLSGKAAAELQGGSGIKSQTIHSLLQELDSGKRQFTNKDILVMDEAAMTDTRLMSRVKDAVEKAGAKLIKAGDTKQLQAVGAGGTFGKVSREIGSAEILEVRRQKVEWQKQAANDFRNGHSASALGAYKANDALHIDKTTKQTHENMVQCWNAKEGDMSEKMMIAGRRADVAKLNRLARSELKKAGELGAETTTITADRNGNESKTKVAQGERLRFTKNDKNLELMNGDLATVKDINIDENGNTILDVELDRKNDQGENVQAQIKTSDYNQFQHGYCITAHASQGATVDNAFFYASEFNSKEMAYVSGSRQRYGCEIFASQEEVGEIVEGEIDKEAEAQKLTAKEISKIEENLEKLTGKNTEEKTALEQAEAAGIDTKQLLSDSDSKMEQAENKVKEAESKSQQAESKAQQAESKAQQAENKAKESEQKQNSGGGKHEQAKQQQQQAKNQNQNQNQKNGGGNQKGGGDAAAKALAAKAKEEGLHSKAAAHKSKINGQNEAQQAKNEANWHKSDALAEEREARKQAKGMEMSLEK